MKDFGFQFKCLFLLITFCSTHITFSQTTENNLQSVSPTYKPPVFNEDKRVEKINEIFPAMQKLMEEHASSRNIPGVAFGIVVDNELVFSSANGLINLEQKLSASPQSIFRIASMTKSFTAMAILKLRDEGKLSLSDPVVDYIPEMSALDYLTSDSPIIDIKNLLTMTAGFPEDNPWGDRQLHQPDQMLLDLISDGISLSNPASFTYEYSNTGYAMLGKIINEISGQPYQEYIRENIFKPLGMHHTYWEYDSVPENQLALGYRREDGQWKLEPMLHDGSFGAMGGLLTSIEDFSKYVSFHLNAWPARSNGEKGPLKRSSLREMHVPTFSRLNASATDLKGETCPIITGYGYGLGISQDCHGRKWISHGGALPGFASNYIFYPDYGVGIMAFGNLTYTGPLPAREIEKLLFETIGLQPRQLPASEILLTRQKQVVELIQHWDPVLESEILADNFYLDKSRTHRMAEIKELFSQTGSIQEMQEIQAQNQLRGGFKLNAENGNIDVFFTLSPEADAKVQFLHLSFSGGD